MDHLNSSVTANHREWPGVDPDDSPPSFTAAFAIVLVGISALFDLYCTQPLLPMFVQVFHATKAAVGLTVSAATLGVALAAPIVGSYAEHHDRKRMMVGSILALVIPTMLAATAHNLPELVLYRFLQGILLPGIFATSIAYITEEWSATTVAIVMAVYVSGTVLGGFLGRLVAGLIADRYGWRLSFVVLAGLNLIGGLLVALWLPESKRRSVAFATRVESHLKHTFEQLKNMDLLITFVVGFNILFALVATFTYVTFHLAAHPYGFSTADLSLLFSVYLVGLVATPAGGVLLVRIDLRRGMLIAVLIILGGVLLTLAAPLWIIVVGLVLCSSGVFIAQAAAMSYLRQASPPGARVAAAGMYLCFYYIGGTAGGIVPSYAWEVGGWTACVALTVAVQVLTIALILFGWRQRATGIMKAA